MSANLQLVDDIAPSLRKLAEFDGVEWEFKKIPLDLIDRGEYQPRRNFDPVKLDELAASLRSTGGNSQTITLRPKGDRYELIAGERRWRALQIAEIPFANAMISDLSNRQSMIIGMVENVQREDLNVMEEAEGFLRMVEEGGLTHLDIAAATGKSRTSITNSIRLTGLDIRVRDLLRAGKLMAGHGKIIAGLESPIDQRAIALEAVKRNWSARQVEAEAARIKTGVVKPAPETKGRDLLRLEETVSERLGFPCSISAQTSGKCQLTIRFADNDGLQAFLIQQKLIEE